MDPQNRTIGEFDSLDIFFTNRQPICPPRPTGEFKISSKLIALVEQHQFRGLEEEQPIDHIEKFEEICATRRCSGVSEDYLKCTLFSFSLVEKAYKWMRALPAGSITTWDEYKRAFLKNFYPKERLKWMRRRISEFRHEAHESFFEAVSRFKEYKRECPHHGFTEIALLNFFYQGVDEKFKMALNITSQGDFMTNTVAQANTLIDNLAASNKYSCLDYEKNVEHIKPSSDFSEILELKSMVAQFLKNQQRDAYQCENMGASHGKDKEECNGDNSHKQQGEVNYIDAREERLEAMMQQLMENQQHMMERQEQNAQEIENLESKWRTTMVISTEKMMRYLQSSLI
ncbi:unnamed protein product [Microthlaspi erraticum]|uniref:Retrotransposon gag domain-containing protein n=1 Tax=Microthlaspi erraticum TaxID=1685480 RepID=A0A6D2KJ24_9BRAS|nr:unnamed protein product [Microthlaspi erraticum]